MSKPSLEWSISRCAPHLVVVYLLHCTGLQLAEIASQFSATRLGALLELLEEFYSRHQDAQPIPACRWLRIIRRNMQRKLKTLIRNRPLRNRYMQLLDKPANDTTLANYYGTKGKKDLRNWLAAVEDLRLISRALEGDDDAFAALLHRYEPMLCGFVGARVRNLEDARDICQDIRCKIWQKLPQYDPARGTFQWFLKYWARIKLMQYWANLGKIRAVEKLFSELQAENSDASGEPEIQDLLARLTGHAAVAPQPDFEMADRFDILLRLLFSAGNPPHQLFGFILAQLLEWKESKIVAELSDVAFEILVPRLIEDLTAVYGEHGAVLADCTTSVNATLAPGRVLDGVLTHPKTRKSYRHLLARPVRSLCLRDFYTGDPFSAGYLKTCSQNITNWNVSVERRVFKAWSTDPGTPPAAVMA